MRPIDADALKVIIGQVCWDYDEMLAVQKTIDEQPTIDPPQGEWEERFVEYASPWFRRRFYCSNCGNWNTYGMTRYCPDCGAKMKVGE